MNDPREKTSNQTEITGEPQEKTRVVSRSGPAESGESIRSGPGGFPVADPPENFVEARQLFENGFYERSLKRLQDLYERYPQSANVNYLLGISLRKTGEYEEAQQYLKRCAQLNHDPQLKYWCQYELDR